MYIIAERGMYTDKGETNFFKVSDKTNKGFLMGQIDNKSASIDYNGTKTGESKEGSENFLEYIKEKSLSKGHSVILIRINLENLMKAANNETDLNKTTFTLIHEMEFHGLDLKDGNDDVSGAVEHQRNYKLSEPSPTSPNYEDISPNSRAGQIKRIIETTKKY